MAARPVFHRELGLYLEGLRKKADLGQRQAALILQTRGLKKSYSALQLLEAGRVKNPNMEIIRALAGLYRRPFEELRAKVLMATHGISSGETDSSRHEATPETDHSTGRKQIGKGRGRSGHNPKLGGAHVASPADSNRQTQPDDSPETYRAIIAGIQRLAALVGEALQAEVNGRKIPATEMLESLLGTDARIAGRQPPGKVRTPKKG